MESDCETAAPVSREISCGLMVHTWGNLRTVLRNGQLWMVTFTPSVPSDCSTSVPARPIQATTLRSFPSNSSPSRSRSMAPACLAATRAKTSSSASGPPISWTSCRTIVASCPYRLGKTASARSVRAKRSEGRPRPLRSGWLTTRPSRSRLVRCWRTALGVTPRSLAMVSALQRPLRRSSSRTSMRVERPAIMRGTSGRLFGMLAQAKPAKSIYYRWSLTKGLCPLNLVCGGDRGMPMIKQASRAIEHMTARERRIQRAKYARRNKIRYIDKLLNELEMLNLADQRQMPPVLSVAINKVIEESPEVTVLAQAKPASVMEAMDALYEIQDSLMYNQLEEE